MKQYITYEQYEDLSVIAKIKLKEWLSDKGYPTNTPPTIGYLIEYLSEVNEGYYWKTGEISYLLKAQEQNNKWYVGSGTRVTGPNNGTVQETELVDALWHLVKERLERTENEI